jgi:hypothetical protein
MTISIVLLAFYFIFDRDESLRINCHKRMKVIPIYIYIFMEFEVSLIFHVMSKKFLFGFIERLRHIEFGENSLHNLHIGT